MDKQRLGEGYAGTCGVGILLPMLMGCDMNKVDYDSAVCDCDGYGNVTVGKTYKGFVLEVSDVSVKVWDADDNFIGKFSTITEAKAVIDNLL